METSLDISKQHSRIPSFGVTICCPTPFRDVNVDTRSPLSCWQPDTMHHLYSWLVLLATLAWTIAASLQPWEITRVSVSGLPWRGDEGLYEPLNTLAVEVRDTNDYADPSALSQCITKFSYGAPPYGAVFNCTEVSYGRWTFAFFPPPPQPDREQPTYWTPGQNFTLALRLAVPSRGVWLDGRLDFSVTAEGNLRGRCSSGGICGFSAKEELLPLRVNQTSSM